MQARTGWEELRIVQPIASSVHSRNARPLITPACSIALAPGSVRLGAFVQVFRQRFECGRVQRHDAHAPWGSGATARKSASPDVDCRPGAGGLPREIVRIYPYA
jgi:hypothetical protein